MSAKLIVRLGGGILVALVLATAAPGSPAKRKPPVGFTRATLTGTWNGTWTDTRFNVTGTAALTVKAPVRGTALIVSDTFGGNVAGCPPPGIETVKLVPGLGPNHWNARGFTITKVSPSFGTVTLSYVQKTHTLTGAGTLPSSVCYPVSTWAMKGIVMGKTFTANLTATLKDGSTTQAVMSLKRA